MTSDTDIQIWYYDTTTKPGFADVWVYIPTKNLAYMFESKHTKCIYQRMPDVQSIAFFIKKDFSFLASCPYDKFIDVYPNYYKAINFLSKVL